MTPLDQIKALMKSGDVAGAEALCRQALEADPDNVELKMRYGLCRQLQGDEETFRRIHDELAPEMEKKPTSLWRKYHKLWLTLIVGALVIAGSVGAVICYGNGIKDSFNGMLSMYAGPVGPKVEIIRTEKMLYAAPRNDEFERLDDVRPDSWGGQ